MQRRAGIKTISYHHLSAQEEGSTADLGAFVSEDRDQHMRNGKDFLANHAKYGMNLIPLVAGLAPELELELYDGMLSRTCLSFLLCRAIRGQCCLNRINAPLHQPLACSL